MASKKAIATTERIITRFRGLPGEFYMLKGLLCADGGDAIPYGSNDHRKWRSMIVSSLIAKRMDEINAGK